MYSHWKYNLLHCLSMQYLQKRYNSLQFSLFPSWRLYFARKGKKLTIKIIVDTSNPTIAITYKRSDSDIEISAAHIATFKAIIAAF